MAYPMAPGYWYSLVFTVSGRTAGTITPQLGTAEIADVYGTARSTNATFTETLFCPLGTIPFLAFVGSSAFDGDIYNVTLTPLDWILLDGRAPAAESKDTRVQIYMTTEA
jgi:hypothetical protein